MWRPALLLLAIFALRPLAAGAEDNLELAVKATYLVKFLPFVTWPAAAFVAPDSPLLICVAGPDPFGALLDRAADGQSVNGHALRVHHLENATGGPECQLLYIAPENAGAARRTIEAVRGRPVLTVTDAGPESEPEGMLNFVMTEGRVRFTIDDDAAREGGLDISSKLLRLAVSVRRGDSK
jgi:hypothetical protein